MRLLGAGYKHCRISGATRQFANRNCVSGNFARDLDNFSDTESAAGPEIADHRLVGFQTIQSQHVSGAKSSTWM